MYLVGFLRREDAGTSRLPDFLHIVPVRLLLQGLVCLALTRIVLDRLLQTARNACVDTGTTFNCFRTFSLLYDYLFFSISGSVSSGRGYDCLPICFLLLAFVCSRATFRRVLQPFNRESGHSSSCKFCVHARSRRTRWILRKLRLLFKKNVRGK